MTSDGWTSDQIRNLFVDVVTLRQVGGQLLQSAHGRVLSLRGKPTAKMLLRPQHSQRCHVFGFRSVTVHRPARSPHATADHARCTVARPQRSARATARTLSPATRRRRVSPSHAARFSGAPVAKSCHRFQPARFPPRHNHPSSAGSPSPVEDVRADGTSSRERSTRTAAGCHGSRARPSQHSAAPAAAGTQRPTSNPTGAARQAAGPAGRERLGHGRGGWVPAPRRGRWGAAGGPSVGGRLWRAVCNYLSRSGSCG